MIRRTKTKRTYKHALSRAALLATLAVMGTTSVAQAQTLLTSDARYPRVRLLPSGELIASVLSFPGDDNIKIFSSTNSGASFTQVGTINDPEFQTLKSSSPNLFRVPQAVGSLAAGTLILGIVVDTQKTVTSRAKIKIYKSTDDGRNWSFVSVAVSSANSQGLWEPDFSMGTDGALVMHYADESSSCCSQKLVRRRTYDGVNWIDQTNDVALMSDFNLRPGMPVVSNLADGTRLMTYEVCGQAAPLNCATYYKTSTDGWNYGSTSTIGTRITDSLGRFFSNTPVNKVLPDGSILWIGQYMRVADGSPSGLNGTVMFKSASGSPNGPWATLAAPVTLANPVTNGCEGFSPGLQWVASGATIVELQTRLEGGVCKVYFGSGPAN
ncbi:exo-alpha-sialidase [Sphingomonas sp. R-74633]|uniref:exo-alpha-sialidase n=1 Tax=Sphingomonas sp. R-74633 TaxID=2751188 RepID=UPI0015D1401D|nr:exo-alpha-sialidase [Sphingomonas sp. R-74633]NYT40765.1 exo-alpha-sialidase [Sphingomonas sp. R-74633]